MHIGPARGHIANSMALKNRGIGLKILALAYISQKTTPFSCKEHISSSKNEEMTRFLRFFKKISQTTINKSRKHVSNLRAGFGERC